MDAKTDAEKVLKVMSKGSQNGAKMMPKSMKNRFDFGTCDFGVCRVYSVKIVFLHDQGYQKSTQNQSKIDAKTS